MRMIDIGSKESTLREAIVGGEVNLKPEIIQLINKKALPKGDVLEAAKTAGILAAKETPHLIPLCHPIPLEFVDISFFRGRNKIKITTTVRAKAKTGVEMEAMTATAIAALTIYDMCKPLDRSITIANIRLIKKSGGKSGAYLRNKKSK